jgi:hypothetical protein
MYSFLIVIFSSKSPFKVRCALNYKASKFEYRNLKKKRLVTSVNVLSDYILFIITIITKTRARSKKKLAAKNM